MSPEQAEIIAIQALGWLAGQEDLFGAFLGAGGAAPQEIASRAGDPAFLASVLEFLTSDDAFVRGFCDAVGLAYDQPLQARYRLPGAEMVHWT